MFKALLVSFIGFVRLTNLGPLSIFSYDASRHLTGHDVIFSKKFGEDHHGPTFNLIIHLVKPQLLFGKC